MSVELTQILIAVGSAVLGALAHSHWNRQPSPTPSPGPNQPSPPANHPIWDVLKDILSQLAKAQTPSK
jgi:hypothetical protein